MFLFCFDFWVCTLPVQRFSGCQGQCSCRGGTLHRSLLHCRSWQTPHSWRHCCRDIREERWALGRLPSPGSYCPVVANSLQRVDGPQIWYCRLCFCSLAQSLSPMDFLLFPLKLPGDCLWALSRLSEYGIWKKKTENNSRIQESPLWLSWNLSVIIWCFSLSLLGLSWLFKRW